MSDIGTITEIEPEDGLGWIELGNGDRVRFGGTACKGFVPAIGMLVEIIGTKAGYRGVLKATELRKAPKGAVPTQAPSSAGAPAATAASAPASPPASPPAAAPRTALHTLTSLGVGVSDLLSTVVGRSDVDHAFHGALAAAGLDPSPAPASALGSKNPWFLGVVRDAAGAYGLYVHPMLAEHPEFPWVRWDRDGDRLQAVAPDTASFLGGLLMGLAPTHRAALGPVWERLGVAPAEAALQPGPAEWLPPEGAALRPLDDYLNEADGVEMERGLLAYAWRHGDANALSSLNALYQAWEWVPPS
ncbi:MAG: hypothetical protein AB8I08_35225 [Sandaracinaceae bacterium]